MEREVDDSGCTCLTAHPARLLACLLACRLQPLLPPLVAAQKHDITHPALPSTLPPQVRVWFAGQGKRTRTVRGRRFAYSVDQEVGGRGAVLRCGMT